MPLAAPSPSSSKAPRPEFWHGENRDELKLCRAERDPAAFPVLTERAQFELPHLRGNSA
jgi:hypothetical protein